MPDLVLVREVDDSINPLKLEFAYVWDLKTGDDQLIGSKWAREVINGEDLLFEPETINPTMDPAKIPVPKPVSLPPANE